MEYPVNRGPSGAHGTEVAGLLAAGINKLSHGGSGAGSAPGELRSHLDSNFVVAADDQLMDAYQISIEHYPGPKS